MHQGQPLQEGFGVPIKAADGPDGCGCRANDGKPGKSPGNG